MRKRKQYRQEEQLTFISSVIRKRHQMVQKGKRAEIKDFIISSKKVLCYFLVIITFLYGFFPLLNLNNFRNNISTNFSNNFIADYIGSKGIFSYGAESNEAKVSTKEKSDLKDLKEKEQDESQKSKVKNFSNALIYCDNTGENLYRYRSELKVPLTLSEVRLMASIVSVQKLPLEKNIEMTKAMLSDDSRVLGLKKGDKVTVETLLNGLLLSNSKTCLKALALTISDSEKDFVNILNIAAKNYSLKETNFKVLFPKGDNKKQGVSNASDFLEMGKIINDDKTLLQIIKREKYSGNILGTKRKVTFVNDNYNVEKAKKLGIIGIISSSNNDYADKIFFYSQKGLNLIGVFYNLGDRPYLTMEEVLGKVETKVKGIKKISKGEVIDKVFVRKGAETSVPMVAKEDGIIYLPKEAEESLVKVKVIQKKSIEAPIKRGEELGVAYITVGGDKVLEVPLVSPKNIEKGWVLSYIGISNKVTLIILGVIAFIVLFIIWRRINILKSRRRRQKKREKMIMRRALKELEEERERRRRGFWD